MQLISQLAAAGVAVAAFVGFTAAAPSFDGSQHGLVATHVGNSVVAAKGRGKPEDNGIDNPDGCDDNGIDGACRLTIAKGSGRGKPEDNGIDNPDGCDDNGIDGACLIRLRG